MKESGGRALCIAATIAAVVVVGCSTDDEPTGRAASPVVFGEDNRVQAEDAPAIQRDRALSSVVALVRQAKVRPCDPVTFDSVPLGEREMLCDTEPFVDEPSIASCSGTLIDDNLVLTAGHCMPDEAACRGFRFVTGLYLQDDKLRTIAPEDVYSCARMLVNPASADIAIVELDRPVTGPYVPAPIGQRQMVGDPLFVAGFPTGIPMKVANSCSLLEIYAPGNEYRTNCDTFAGNSGSGVFDDMGAVVGVISRGPGDYKPRAPGDCFIRATLDEDGRLPGFPGASPQLMSYTPVDLGVTVLCDSGYPSERLCARAPVCPACPGETPSSCPDGCTPAACGDGVCDLGEALSCDADCGAIDPAICGDTMPPPPPPPPVDEPPPAGPGVDDTRGEDEIDTRGGCTASSTAPRHETGALVALAMAGLVAFARRRRA